MAQTGWGVPLDTTDSHSLSLEASVCPPGVWAALPRLPGGPPCLLQLLWLQGPEHVAPSPGLGLCGHMAPPCVSALSFLL